MDFRLGKFIEVWELIILVTHATFDAAVWSDEPQPVQSIHNGVSVIFKDFNFVFFVKKKTLQESLSVQMDLNQESEEGLILNKKENERKIHEFSN